MLDSSNNGTDTVTVTGLPASIAGTGSTPYDVIVYMAADTTGRGGVYTVNGSSQTAVTLFPSDGTGPFVLANATTAGTYLIFTGVTGTTMTLTSLANGASVDYAQRAPIDGLQIITAPEPSALALLAVGGMSGLALLMVRRRISG